MRAALLALWMVGCAEDVGKNRTEAVVTDVPPAVETPAAPVAGELPEVAGATKLKVAQDQSKLGALGAKVTAQHPISFKDFSGEVGIDGEELKGVGFVAQLGTLESDSERLTEHLKDEDFFHVAKFPTATFKSTEISAGSDVAGMTHTIKGELTLRGTTKQVLFPAKVTIAADKVEASTEFVINRQDFGITYPGKQDDLIQDNVAIQVQFVAPRG